MKHFSHLILLIIAVTLYGCGGSGSSSSGQAGGEPEVMSAQFVDSAVQGLEYETATQSGFTDEDGTFYYLAGETIVFRIGDVEVGRLEADNIADNRIATPLDLVAGAVDATEPQVINLCRFIQSLDEDRDPENGIVITPETHDKLEGKSVNFDQSQSEFANDSTIRSIFGVELPHPYIGLDPAYEATCHMHQTLYYLETGNRWSRCDYYPGRIKVHYHDHVTVEEIFNLAEQYDHDYTIPRYLLEPSNRIALIPEDEDMDWHAAADEFWESGLTNRVVIEVRSDWDTSDPKSLPIPIPGTLYKYFDIQLKPGVTYEAFKSLMDSIGSFMECGRKCLIFKHNRIYVPHGEEQKWIDIYMNQHSDIVRGASLYPIAGLVLF